ncbi:MAG: rRNA maturation RNase YbeY [Proteobacteria bacterium]|nr:rRNA maturation RNase YbeY [Pseudomonadota bacterium]
MEDLLISLKLQDKSLSILFINNTAIKKLNKNYFNKDKPTNVISFSYIDDLSCGMNHPNASLNISTRNFEQICFNTQGAIMGDIAISLERAREEAEDINCHFYERVFALIVHGLLHVLGFDHENGKNEARKMRYRENKLMDYIRSHKLYKELVFQYQP